MRQILCLLSALFFLIPIASAEGSPAVSDISVETILVTGITGRQGGAVARELLRRGYSVRGLTRNPESQRARALTELEVELFRGNFDDAASLDSAFDGADGVFAVTDFWEHGYEQEIAHGRNLIDAAVRAGTSFLVFSSVASADQATNIPHFDSKWEIEKYLRKSGLDHAVVRPVSFMENWSLDDDDVIAGRIVTAGNPSRPNQYISVSDIARFVADAFDAPGRWNGVALNIAADEISLTEICEILTEITGRPVSPEQVSWADYESLAGEEMTTMSRWFDAVGYSVDVAALRKQNPGMMMMEGYLRSLIR
ncbi:MAG: NmrA/HSCARG family protein [Gammaproteobacteria bacterium]|nr:NmrA/HSCARG family protein [Gammaproteobacteria bacterium]